MLESGAHQAASGRGSTHSGVTCHPTPAAKHLLLGCWPTQVFRALWIGPNALSVHPAPGKIVSVGGHKMHIYCTGSGSPTIVLEAGGQNDSVIWRGVQPALSRTTRVCAYDRAGFGWSDAQPGPRDADHIAAELHQLLLQTGITGPVVLMGHSIGGIFLRDYVTHYPTNVVGIVFVDSSTPFQYKNPAMKVAGSGPPSWVFNLAMIVGVPRLLGMCGSMQGVGDHTKKLQAEAICRLHNSAFAEVDSIDLSSQQTLNSGPYGALPILIISHDPSKQLPANPSQRDFDRQNAWSQMQEDL
jgi:pimeloyl-ACP methyl ester carboxylesterase